MLILFLVKVASPTLNTVSNDADALLGVGVLYLTNTYKHKNKVKVIELLTVK